MPFAVIPDLTLSKLVASSISRSSVRVPVLDMDSHSTRIASTIAETTNNSLALTGLAYNVQIMPVKVCIPSWKWRSCARRRVHVLPATDAGGVVQRDQRDSGKPDNGARSSTSASVAWDLADAGTRSVRRAARRVRRGLRGTRMTRATRRIPGRLRPGIDGVMSLAARADQTRAFYSSTGSTSKSPHPEATRATAAPRGHLADDAESG